MSRTVRTPARLAIAATATVGLVASGAAAAHSSPRVHATPRAHASVAKTPHLKVRISKKHFVVKGPTSFQAGRVDLKLKAVGGEREVEIVKFKKGYSFHHLRKDLLKFGEGESESGATKSALKHLNNAVSHTLLYGGLDAARGQTLKGSVVLPKGGKYVIYNDSGNLPTHPKTLHVSGPRVKRASPNSTATVKATSAKRFRGAVKLPAKGTITFKNTSNNSPHFLALQHVKKGTTRKQIMDYFNDPQGPPSFFRNGGADTDVVGEGMAQTLSYKLPKGEYAEMCFFPDLQTGVPHAFMGMVRIVHLEK